MKFTEAQQNIAGEASPSGSDGITSTLLRHAAKMDEFYRWRRYVYDITRFYLVGRDALLFDMQLNSNDGVLEIGCGTSRNLIRLARLSRHIRLFGLDASTQMLKTGSQKIQTAGFGSRILLKHGFAETFHFRETFGLDAPFDLIFFSYSLSMVPNWRPAVDRALNNLAPAGSLVILDFGDGADLPGLLRQLTGTWLRRYRIHYDCTLLDYLANLHVSGVGIFRFKWLTRRYAYLAHFQKREH
jgi:S-adenosylmethionine-diacylgycerolhomoserine-N-methlytransferase